MIQGVQVKELKLIRDERGFLMEILRSDDKLFQKFGQVYMSCCKPGFAKAWHYHKVQTDHFAVVSGKAKIVLYDTREDSPTKGEINEFIASTDKPLLIKIPPLVAHGYTALDGKPACIINCPTELYNYDSPDEHRIPFDSKEIGYDWGVERGG